MRTRKVCEPLGAESQAFMELFYEEHRRFMFYTAWQLARNREDCEDAVQEALERMMKNIASLRQISRCKIRRYIVLTIRTVFLDMEKQRNKALILSLDDALVVNLIEKGLLEAEHMPDMDPRLDVERLKRELSERDWILLEGKYILELDNAALGNLVGVSPDSVRMLLVRARKTAKEILLESARERG